MEGRLWDNPEIRSLTFKLLAVGGLLTLLTLVLTNYVWVSLNRKLIENNLAIIGRVVSLHPELKHDLLPSFTREASIAEIQQGLAAAREYGYDTSLPLNTVPILREASYQSLSAVGLISGIYSLLLLGVVLWWVRKPLQKINRVALAAERIVEGNFTLKFNSTGEGAFAKLEHCFDQMSRRLELTLDALQQEKIYLKNMVSDISHQLKTPISSLKVFNELLLEESGCSQTYEFLQRSSSQIERMEWLTGNLLKLARIDAGSIEFNCEYLPLLPTIEEAVSALNFRWQKKCQLVSINGNMDICLPHDKKWLGEAIRNIIKNSIEHTPEGGSIEIYLADTPVMGRIIIKDNGTGIHKEDLPYIFQRFYQGKYSRGGSGTGIGLALAKVIIENQGGLIAVKSEQGKGTEFVISFVKRIM